jgi:hypothetical protein
VRTTASLEERLHELEERERYQGHNQRGPEAEAEQCMSRPAMPTSSTSCSDESEARRLFAGVRARRELEQGPCAAISRAASFRLAEEGTGGM